MKAIDGAESLLANIYFLKVPGKKKGERERGTQFNCFSVPCAHMLRLLNISHK